MNSILLVILCMETFQRFKTNYGYERKKNFASHFAGNCDKTGIKKIKVINYVGLFLIYLIITTGLGWVLEYN